MFDKTRKAFLKLALVGAMACMVVGCLPKAAVAEDVPGIEGLYRAGQGDVRISQNGEVYQIRWDYPDGSRWIGVGLLNGDTLSFAWDLPRGGNLGICVYKVEKGEKGPKLVGHWAAYQDKRATADTLIFVSK